MILEQKKVPELFQIPGVSKQSQLLLNKVEILCYALSLAMKNSKFAQIWAYLKHGKCFQDAPDLFQLEPGPVAKAKQIQQKASLFQG